MSSEIKSDSSIKNNKINDDSYSNITSRSDITNNICSYTYEVIDRNDSIEYFSNQVEDEDLSVRYNNVNIYTNVEKYPNIIFQLFTQNTQNNSSVLDEEKI